MPKAQSTSKKVSNGLTAPLNLAPPTEAKRWAEPSAKLEDWVFGSERAFGKLPVWADSLRTKILQPAAKRVGITKRVGWLG